MLGNNWIFVLIILDAVVYGNHSTKELNKRQSQVSTPMRLVNGTSKYEGRLEVFHNHTWGTVCDDGFTDRTASTVCRLLQLGTHGFQKQSAPYGAGTFPILLDDVVCIGTENDIDQCRHNPWGSNNCGHTEDVGIQCFPWDVTTTRLVGGVNPWEGRLEVLLGNEWRSVCSSGFRLTEARVACRSMNYSSSDATLVNGGIFAAGSFPTSVENIQCAGNEEELLYCNIIDTASTCQTLAAIECSHTPIRLVGGPSVTEGRVEIQYKGQWGTVCANGFGQEEAQVICLMLGHGLGQAQANVNNAYGSGTGTSLLKSLQCNGNEQDLSACVGATFRNYSCGNIAGVNCTYTPVRLVNGSTPYEGRVELFYNGSWGTVCDDNFDTQDSRVICRMLGFSNGSPQYFANAHFGSGSGLILLDDLACIGTEKDIALCKSNGWTNHNCGHSEDVSVVCSNDWELRLNGANVYWDGKLEIKKNGRYGSVCKHGFTKNIADSVCNYLGFNKSKRIYFNDINNEMPKWTIDSSCSFNGTNGINCSIIEAPSYCNIHMDNVWLECARNPVRLVQGSSPGEGRVEILYDNHWGTVCRTGFDVNDATVICNMLGYEISAPTVYSYTRFGQGDGPVWVSNLDCSGFENDVSACKSAKWIPGSCSHNLDVSIACGKNLVRLANGSMPFEGRLELYHNSVWRTWSGSVSSYTALTFCRMMGYNETDIISRAFSSITFGNSPALSSWSVSSYCTGKEMDISGCIRNYNRYSTWSYSTYHNDQGVSCNLNVRLSNGPNRMTGRLELLRKNVWGTVCDINFTNIHATAICRMMAGPNQARYVTGTVLQAGFFGKGTGPTWKFRDRCGTDGDIARCLFPDSHFTECDHNNDVSIICKSTISIRLTGGSRSSEGTIEMQKNGTWGALCDDYFYRADGITTCKQLGFWVNSATLHGSSYFGRTTLPKWILQPNCGSNDFDVSLCDAAYPYQKRSCSTAGVNCIATALGRNNIRLNNGKGDWVGMIEVKLNSNWGGICWSNWDNSSTDVVCRMLRYKGGVFQSYPVTKGIEPLFVANLNCTGNEDDIGLCTATNDISVCSDYAVSVDCSGGVEVRLVGGNSSFEGRVEIKANGTWGTLCDSSWSFYDAKVICSMIGFSDTSPILINNAHFGQGSGAVKYTDLGCSGWEDHIGQCNKRASGTCSHSNDAGVKCFNCVQEYTTETGTTASPNYPGYYPSNSDCVYVIKPKQNGTAYILLFDDFRLACCSDYVEILEESSKHHIAKYNYYSRPDLIPGKNFLIRFRGKTSYPGFHLSWKPLTVQDIVTAGCGSSTWDISINMTLLKYLYPDSRPNFIFMNNPNCKGVMYEDSLVFKETYADCGTNAQTTSAGTKYTNTIMYPEVSGESFPTIIRHFRWKMDVDCIRLKTNTGNLNFRPDEATSTTKSPNSGVNNPDGHVGGSIQHSVEIQFYKDQGFFEELTDNPLVLHIGENVYVKVSTKATTGKMRLHTCKTSPYSGSAVEYILIKDGCIKDTTTHILTQTNRETKFVFTAFEFPTYTSNVYVTCNATFCNTNDYSDECNQRCHNVRRARSVQPHETVTGRSRTFVIRNGKKTRNEPSKENEMNLSEVRYPVGNASNTGY